MAVDPLHPFRRSGLLTRHGQGPHQGDLDDFIPCATQCASTFPAGFSSTGRDGDSHELKAWKLIDKAGCRGLMIGGARVSQKHCNFLINTGSATAADLEQLGETVRARVKTSSGIDLCWEIRRIGVIVSRAKTA